MHYYLFIDESGDHGLKNIDANFPVFVLCGALFSFESHASFVEKMYAFKTKFWNSKEVIFHSRDIRKCDKEFSILLNLDVKNNFYNDLNAILTETDYTIISAVIQKEDFTKKYGKTGNVYSVALSFIIERAVFFLDAKANVESINIIVEKRGKKEDLELSKYYNSVRSYGTGYVDATRIMNYNMTLRFKAKKENINGLQIADLIAYPIANHIKDPKRVNPAFEVIKPKFYTKNGHLYGLKKFP